MACWSLHSAYPVIFLRPDVRVKTKKQTKKAITVSSGNVTGIEQLSFLPSPVLTEKNS